MAYGMRPDELAAVGQNINQNNAGQVDEQAIQRGIQQELSEDRKDTVEKNRQAKKQADDADRQAKTQLKANLINAVVDSAVKVGGAVLTSDAMQAKHAAGKEARLTARADKMVGRGVDPDKIAKVRTRAGEAGFKAAKLNPEKYGKVTAPYQTPGSLYGKRSAPSPSDTGVERSAGKDPTAANLASNYQSQLVQNRKYSTPISSKEQYIKASNELAALKAQFGK